MKEDKIFIRDIIDEDYEMLTEFIEELGYPSNKNNISQRLFKINSNKSYKTLVAEVDNKVVGFIGLCKLYAYEYDGEYVRIISLVVNEKHRGNGIGTILMKSAEKWAINEGAIAIALNSGIKREKAHEFYKSNGYKIKGYSFSKSLDENNK
ncbi:GNAT family N-acetyltransferase [Clostridium sp. C2-6-12]|uniref:GNAT family N-acetyltransferase n=1 Tax=Clostridium sp. C2-6-12 TaxID=2698832 RepID=UPI001920AEAC|nr:GNAT family N-acetyltransferase [Clostridium sp. C2-6-12]